MKNQKVVLTNGGIIEFLHYISMALNADGVRGAKIAAYASIIAFTKKYFIDINKAIRKEFANQHDMLDDFKQNTTTLKYITKFTLIVNIMEKIFSLKDFESHKKNFMLVSDAISIDYALIKKFYNHAKKSFLLDDLHNSNTIRFEFINGVKGYNYRKLSTGEKQLLEFIVSFAYTIKNMEYTDKSIIFIEEIEISMHPQWQKKLLNIIINVFKKLGLFNSDLNYQILFATHSPFILSDMPKENVIFLEKYNENDSEVKNNAQKIGNCKNVTRETNIETFGANIHTLLSHGFFMEGGLIGEYAKLKINELVDYLNGEKSPIEDDLKAQRYINVIGEPILKKQLQRMLDKKHPSEVDELKKENKNLKRELEELRSAKN